MNYHNHNFHDYVNVIHAQFHKKDTKNFLLKFLKILPIIVWRTIKDAGIELLFLAVFWLILVKMSQGRDLIVSIFEPNGLYGNIRIIFTTLAVLSYSVSMWIIPAFLFHQRALKTKDSPNPQNPFTTHLFFMHRVLPLVPFWLLASALFNGSVWVFVIAAIAELVILIYLDRLLDKNRRARIILMAALGLVLIITTLYFFYNFQTQYTSMKVILAVNLYLLSVLMHQAYQLHDTKILAEHNKPTYPGQSLIKKYKVNSVIYFACLGAHITILLLIYYMPFELSIAPESMLLYMFSVYVFAIDLFFYFVNVSRKRQLTTAIVSMILFIFLLSPLWNFNLTHYTMDANTADPTILQGRLRDNFADRYMELKEAIDANNSGEPYPIILVSGEGGGSRAGLWFSQNLINFDYDTKGKFRDHIFSLSTVSGSSVGLSTVFSFWDYTRGAQEIDTCWIKLPGEVYENNYVGSSVRGLLLTDLYKSLIPPSWKKWQNDRNATLQYEEAARTLEAVKKITAESAKKQLINDSVMTLRKDLMYYFYEKAGDTVLYRKKTPIALINTCRSNDGRRGIFSSIRLTEQFFNDAIDVAGYLYEDSVCSDGGVRHCYGNRIPISLGQACNTSELFPIFSAPAFIDSLGSFVDGGYHENSGLKSTLDIYQQLKMYLAEDTPKKPYRIYILYLKNGSGEKKLYKKRTSELTLLQPITALYNQPFEGSASYFEEKAKYIGLLDDNVEFIPINLKPNNLVNYELPGVKDDSLAKKLEPEILKDLINDTFRREDGKMDTILRFPLARWLSKTVSRRIQMCASTKNRNAETDSLLARVRRVYSVAKPSDKIFEKYPVHKELKVNEAKADTAALRLPMKHIRAKK